MAFLCFPMGRNLEYLQSHSRDTYFGGRKLEAIKQVCAKIHKGKASRNFPVSLGRECKYKFKDCLNQESAKPHRIQGDLKGCNSLGKWELSRVHFRFSLADIENGLHLKYRIWDRQMFSKILSLALC